MKKLLAFLLVLMLAAGCAGCAKQAETGAAAPEQAAGVPAQTAADASEQEPVPESVPEDVPPPSGWRIPATPRRRKRSWPISTP